jgi:hypothetical protein
VVIDEFNILSNTNPDLQLNPLCCRFVGAYSAVAKSVLAPIPIFHFVSSQHCSKALARSSATSTASALLDTFVSTVLVNTRHFQSKIRHYQVFQVLLD